MKKEYSGNIMILLNIYLWLIIKKSHFSNKRKKIVKLWGIVQENSL